MTEIATIDWFGMWGTSVFSENTAIFWLSVRVAERLALQTSDHGVTGSNPAGGEILPEPKRRFIAQSLSCSPYHGLEMTEILLKGRKTLTYPSIYILTCNFKPKPVHILTVMEAGHAPSPSTYLLLWRLVVDPAHLHTACCGDWSWIQSIHILTVVETGHGPSPSTYLLLWRLVMDPASPQICCCGDWSWTQPVHILTVVETGHRPSLSTYLLFWRLIMDPACWHTVVDTGHGPSPSKYLLFWRLVMDPASPHTYCCGNWSWTQPIHTLTVMETGDGPSPSTY